jgi:hypothetical protein
MPPPNITLPWAKRSAVSRMGAILSEPDEALDQASIAELTSKQISRMTRPELARIVHVGQLPALLVRLEYLDRGTLQRLAHLARLCCRNRTC